MQDPQMVDVAVGMYSARVAEDKNAGKDTYAANPNAREIYFRGVHDTIVTLRAFFEASCSPEAVAVLMQALHDQTVEDAPTH